MVTSLLYQDCWRAILYWCPNFEVAKLWMMGNRAFQTLLSSAPILYGRGHYFSLLREFKGMGVLDIREERYLSPNIIGKLPHHLHTLSLTLRDRDVVSGILPETITTLTVELMKYIKGPSVKINLAALPLGLVDLKVKFNNHSHGARWSEYHGKIRQYEKLTSIQFHDTNIDDSSINSLISRSPALTNLDLSYKKPSNGTFAFPTFPHPEHITTLRLLGLPIHQWSVDLLALFPHTELSVSIYSFNKDRSIPDLKMFKSILSVLPIKTQSLTINAPHYPVDLLLDMSSQLVNLERLKLDVAATTRDQLYLPFPKLRKVTLLRNDGHKLVLSSSFTSVQFEGNLAGPGLPSLVNEQHQVEPGFCPHSISGMSSSFLSGLNHTHMRNLRELVLHDLQPALPKNYTFLCSLTSLQELSVIIWDKCESMMGIALTKLLSACCQLRLLRSLSISINLEEESINVDELIFPDSLTTLVVKVAGEAIIEPKKMSFPTSLVKLLLWGLEYPLELLYELKNAKDLKTLSLLVEKRSHTFDDAQRLLTELPPYLQTIQLYNIGLMFTMSDDEVVRPPQLLKMLRARRPYLQRFAWNGVEFHV